VFGEGEGDGGEGAAVAAPGGEILGVPEQVFEQQDEVVLLAEQGCDRREADVPAGVFEGEHLVRLRRRQGFRAYQREGAPGGALRGVGRLERRGLGLVGVQEALVVVFLAFAQQVS